MGETFLRFKRRANLIRFLRAFFTGAGSGAFAAGVLNLLSRLELITLHPAFSFLIGGGAALVLWSVLFFVGIGDEKLARMLDSELSLDERTLTMLQYRDENSAIHKLQREDAEAALASVPTGKLRFRKLPLYIAIFVLGCAMLTVSFFFSKTEEVPAPPPHEEEFRLTAEKERYLAELIKEVEASEMEETYKEKTVALLEGLIEVLKVTDTVRAKDAAVSLAMGNILSETDASSYAVELITALYQNGHPPLQELALALNYYDWQKTDADKIFYRDMEDKFAVSLVYKPASDVSLSETEDPIVSENALILQKASTGIVGVLSSLNMPADDPLYIALYRLALAEEENADGTRVYGLSRLSEMPASAGLEATEREIVATVKALSVDIYAALLKNRANTETGETVVRRLAVILDTELPAFERPVFNGTSSGGGSDEETGTGGAISGGTEYGSDDLVYDPYTNTYLPYGEVLDRYYALMLGSVENGEHTEKECLALLKYFSILYGGFEEGENSDE